jgi:hypothetical protein
LNVELLLVLYYRGSVLAVLVEMVMVVVTWQGRRRTS